MKNIYLRVALCVSLLLSAVVVRANTEPSAVDINIDIAPPHWQLPAGTAILAQREGKLAPQEQPLAQQLRPLLLDKKYARALALLKAQQGNSPSAALWLLRGQIEQQLKSFAAASTSFGKAIEQLPDFARAHRAQALVEFSLGHYRQARKALARAISLGIHDAPTYGYLGFIELKAGQSYAAAGAYRQALTLAPQNRDWQSGLLYALTESGQYDSARALLSDLINRHPDDSQLWIQYARLQLRTEKLDDALASLEVAMRLGPVSGANRQAAAQLQMQQGNYDRALVLLEKNMAAGDINMTYLSRLGEWLMREQQWHAASKLVENINRQSSALGPVDDARRLYLSARIARHEKKANRAATLLKKATTQAPGFAPALLALAQLHADNQAYSAAELLYSRAAALKGYRRQALTGKAQALINQQRYRESLTLLRKLYNQQPSGELMGNIKALQNIIEQRSE